eukprot:TRINITY_DN11491_c0_g2_i1.p1 TRINITY_DN11491_c0_g2~~TRINITY_DN11491_c0_g2_i1.p1  ORF type:complete len:817 (-),score=237.48 TRINITY_DN11491_c0_g2_i1:399-2849(-)
MAEPPRKAARLAKGDVAFVGLGAMGAGMAKSLVKAGFTVHGFDMYKPMLDAAVADGVKAAASPADACAKTAKGSGAGGNLVLMVVNAAQAEEVLWGAGGAAKCLAKGAAVIMCSTVPPGDAKAIGAKLKAEGLHFVDGPVSGGVAKAAEGALTIMAGGEDAAFEAARSCLEAMSQKLYHCGKRPGDGSNVKMVNQLLAGVHIASSAEAMALGARAGLDTRMLYEIITNAAGNSWMFENRVPRMLDDEYLPAKSQLNIFVKDLGIVLGEARDLTFPCPLAAAAHQQFLHGAAYGFGKLDDSSVVKVFEQAAGIKVAAPKLLPGQRRRWPVTSLSQSLAKLPALAPGGAKGALDEIRTAIRAGGVPKLVVLDDDPTGTQTVHGITVLTDWSVDALRKQLEAPAPGFFILTNSRALTTEDAKALISDICKNVKAAAEASKATYTVVLRGDSTLRGHHPAEADAASAQLGAFDATIICPFFLQGGRYTLNDVHYVAAGDVLTPAAETEFAKDKAFGYLESNLKDWVEEKTKGKVLATAVASISIEELRCTGGPEAICARLLGLAKGSVLVVNAAADADLAVFCAGLLRAESKGRRFLCRTAASFVSARLGIETSRPLLTPAVLPGASVAQGVGGLVMLGSYVKKSTAQVEALIAQRGSLLERVEVSVPAVLADGGIAKEAARAAALADAALKGGRDVLVMTSRTLVHGNTPEESLAIGSKVSTCLVDILKAIHTRPRYLLAKGGITSSDLATKGCSVKQALVAGQAAAGVPVWLLGPGSRWEGMPYIVFPGNVGTEDAVATVVDAWTAKKGGSYAGWWAS